ncbi:antibiotic biosynthesis monooxygenase [Gallaecimonas kandeliae]|uniref:antibiotic biosynthesis monooxygenase family protein n=1 Tax=Gallaecimonas kandeliae TaxID=3029055 RepID=UPI0026489007|nr:antibiotic biosynthesis monooxygenase family protein [Gallaecimonas kandeliae]WKE64852.1 antibiotic biosynthesis monooxygenase [Gallaecimonas kandeliae]
MAQVTLINPFEIPKGQEQEALAHWEKARDFLAGQPGYISTRLHRALDPDARFHLVNVAIWESEAAFRAATAKMRQELGPPPQGVKGGPALYEVIRD